MHADAFAVNMNQSCLGSGHQTGADIGRIKEVAERKQNDQYGGNGEYRLPEEGVSLFFQLFGDRKFKIAGILFGPQAGVEPGQKSCCRAFRSGFLRPRFPE